MGLSGLPRFLERHRRVALDTRVFIYQLESHPQYLPLTDRIFLWLEDPHVEAVTCTVTMTELLVGPYQEVDERCADKLYTLPSIYPNVNWILPSLAIADKAARLRARYRLKTPDALQAATAEHSGASGLITNDPIFTRVPAFETLVLSHLL